MMQSIDLQIKHRCNITTCVSTCHAILSYTSDELSSHHDYNLKLPSLVSLSILPKLLSQHLVRPHI
jgi:hypothetical protein